MSLTLPRPLARRLETLSLFREQLVAHGVVRLAVFFAVVMAAGGFAIVQIERGHNPQFRSLEDGLWWALVTLTTVGYGDKYPITSAGHVVAALVVVLGIGTVGVATARIAGILVEQKIKEGRGLSDAHHLSGHMVLLGWKADMDLLVEEILAVNPELGADRLVLVNLADEVVNSELRARFPGLVYLRGDVIDTLVLQRAHLSRASKVMILADVAEDRSDQEIDARTVMAVMAVKRLAPQVHTCAEILDTQYAEHLRLARCEEVILSREYGRFLLVSASRSVGVSNALHDLMDVTTRRGLATLEIPADLVGRPYGELFARLKGDGWLPIGLLEDTGQVTTIKRRALREAQRVASIDDLVENLRRVKDLTPNRPVLNPPDDHPVPASSLAIVIGRGDAEGEA